MTEALADLGVKKLWSLEMQLTIFIILITIWFRVYMHYFGELLSLLIMGVPVT